jgi:hypothetical protein
MKLLKTETKELVRNPKGDGLFTSTIEYKVTEAKGELTYDGPKIPPLVWHQILSFFKWSYDTTKGESQVRLFVSPKHKTWKAWAFPQQASCGMSTKELHTEDSQKQRAELFTDHEAWIAWGTVHHHCDMSAFQSSVDEADEKNVGGLHITVGDMTKASHSLHARLYHQGDLYEPDMSMFWDIGNLIDRLPVSLKALLQTNAADKLAREQMCAPSDVEFPAKWKENLIEVRQTGFGESMWPEKDGDYKWIGQERFQRQNGVWIRAPWQAGPYGGSEYKKDQMEETKHRRGYTGGVSLDPLNVRIKEAMDSLEETLMAMGVMGEEDVLLEVEEFMEEPTYLAMSRVCKNYHLLPSDLLDAASERLKKSLEKELKEEKEAAGNQNNGGSADDNNAAAYGDV